MDLEPDTRQDHDERPARDRGFGLIENLVAVVLLGLIASTILAGMWTVIRLSRFSDDQAKVASVLGSASDRVANFDYDPCPVTLDAEGTEINVYAGIAKGAAGAVKWPTETVTVISMKYWQPGTGWVDQNGMVATGCNEGTGLTDALTMQKVTIRVEAPGGGYGRSMEVVKTPVRADYNPANDPNNV
jgi:prepilin-type N-terminal cleavage/methylation domain-containing protein